MMSTRLFFKLLLLVGLFKAGTVLSQTSYYQNDSLVVFYPPSFDSSKTLPSLAIVNEPIVTSGLPVSWSLLPEFDTLNGLSTATIAVEKGVDMYGTGEVTGPLKRNNSTITLWNTDNNGYTVDNGKRLYQSHPWVLGLNDDGTSFGIIADNTWAMSIEISDTLIKFSSAGPPFRIIVFINESPQKTIQTLSSLTGKIEMPPLWALGYHQCKYSYSSDSKVREIANNFRSKKLPCDVIWLDIDYMDDFRTFTFNPVYFPNPKGLNDYLHDNNFKSVWIVDPGISIKKGYEPYDTGTLRNYWVLNSGRNIYNGYLWPGICVFPDFTMPAARSWWSGLFPAFMANGIDGIWNDMNEPSILNEISGTMPIGNIHRGGGGLPEESHLRYHNVYGMLEIEATREGVLQANPDKRPFVLTRSNFLGGQRYAATWTGDNQSTWNYLKMSIPMSLNLGLSGQPFSGPDVGGFNTASNGNLFGNWIAIGSFYPFFRNHHTSINDQEPWAFGTAIEQVSRVALNRRYRLLPYLYTLFYDASHSGTPVMQPVFFADPADKNLRSEQEAFLFGDKLLIVPKWSDNPSLPKSTWRSISLAGEDSKLDHYQPDMRLKAGSIIPVGQLIQSTVDYNADSITLLVSLDENHKANGYIYEDAGNGYGYLSGEYLIRNFQADSCGNDSIQILITRTEGNLSGSVKNYRVGIVTNYDILYSAWTQDTLIKVGRPVEINASIISPVSGSSFTSGQNILLTADANCETGIEDVSFYYDDTILIGVTNNAPYKVEWNNIPAGRHTVYAIARAPEDLKMETFPIIIYAVAVTRINDPK